MNDCPTLILAAVAGLFLGAFFFGGLWWTVRKGLSSRYAAVWFLGSLILRLSLVVAGFYWVSGNRWERLMACLVGFVCARLIVFRLTRPLRDNRTCPTREGDHASESR